MRFEAMVRNLDSIPESFAPGRNTALLKDEAEGAELGVLAGATTTLSGTQFVAVDAGPDRHEQITAP